MEQKQFWQLVEQSRQAGSDDQTTQVERLVLLLAELSVDEILEFQRVFSDCVRDAYCWDLVAVARIINSSDNDDGFDAFVGWLVAQGRAYFEAALEDAERAADSASPGEPAELEGIWNAPAYAYERKTGQDDFFDIAHAVSIAMQGNRLDEEATAKRFPKLLKRF